MKRKDEDLGQGDEFEAYNDLIAGTSSEDDEEGLSEEGSEAE